MPRVFISYRRADNSAFTHRLAKDLKDEFEAENIFIDVDDHNILPGVDFLKPIKKAIDKCDVLLAIIGDKWLDELNKRDAKHDVLVMELERAFERGIPVIPITADNATMPSEDDLPESIKAFARRHAHKIQSQAKYYDMEFAELCEIIPQVIEYYDRAKVKNEHPILMLDAYLAWESTAELNNKNFKHRSGSLIYGIWIRIQDTEIIELSGNTLHIKIENPDHYEYLQNEVRHQWVERTLSEILETEMKVVYHLIETPYPEMTLDPLHSEVLLDIEKIQALWVSAQRLIYEHSHTGGDLIINLPNLMEYAKPISLENNVVTIQVSHQIYYKKLIEETRFRWVENALSKVCGIKLQIEYIIEGNQPQNLDDIPF